jgi:hypothetical protein
MFEFIRGVIQWWYCLFIEDSNVWNLLNLVPKTVGLLIVILILLFIVLWILATILPSEKDSKKTKFLRLLFAIAVIFVICKVSPLANGYIEEYIEKKHLAQEELEVHLNKDIISKDFEKFKEWYDNKTKDMTDLQQEEFEKNSLVGKTVQWSGIVNDITGNSIKIENDIVGNDYTVEVAEEYKSYLINIDKGDTITVRGTMGVKYDYLIWKLENAKIIEGS